MSSPISRRIAHTCNNHFPLSGTKIRSFSHLGISSTVQLHRAGSRVSTVRSQSTMSNSGPQKTLRAWFARGGTSNGLVLHRDDLPPQDQWHRILPAAMGSPDHYGRQLNGMGSGISSTSKIVVLGPPSRSDIDVDYTFVQVGIKDGKLDLAGNCGNMSSLVGPVAWDKGLINRDQILEEDEQGAKWARVRFFNTNTSKVLESKFMVKGEPPMFCPQGDYAMDGIPGTGSKVTLSFLDPAGAKTGQALPTGSPADKLHLPGSNTIEASLVDVSNPGVFVRAQDVLSLARGGQLLGSAAQSLTPEAVEADDTLKMILEQVRQAGASRMGLDPKVESVPKVVMVLPSPPDRHTDIDCLAMSMGQAHKAVPLTLALCLGAACQIPKSIPNGMLVQPSASPCSPPASGSRTVTIGHASGMMDIGISTKDGEIVSAELLRTARVMMKGEVVLY